MGARISGISSNLLTIEGVKELHGAEHTLLPDMIEVGSFIGMAAMVGDGITIKNVSIPDLGIIPDAFRRLGIKIRQKGDDLFIPRQPHYAVESFLDGTIMTLADAPWRTHPRPYLHSARCGYASPWQCAAPSENV